MTTTLRRADGRRKSMAPPPTPRPFPLGLTLAFFGVLTIGVFFSTFGRWILSDDFVRTPNGPDSFSDGSAASLHALEVASVAAALYIIWRFLLKPALLQRNITLDGMIIIGGCFLYVYDPLPNMFNNILAYNTHFFNRGSWANYIPGFQAPRQNLLPDPLLFVGAGYVWWIFGSILVGCAILRALRRRFPAMSNGALWLSLGGIIALVDIVVELAFARLEVWRYPAGPALLTIFRDKPYRFPLFEAIFVAAMSLSFTAMRYFKDDKGRSFVVRGIAELSVTSWVRSLLSTLAVTGFMFLATMVAYVLPFEMFAMSATEYSPQPSYMRAGICGDGTAYACPNSAVPVPRRNSLHIAPDDPRLPERVRAEQRSP